MKFCPNCGTYMPPYRKTCPKCSKMNRKKVYTVNIGKQPPQLTVNDVLNNFPSPSLRRYQKDIITETVDAFQTGKKCIILAAPTGFGKSYVNAAFSSLAHSYYATPQLSLIDQIMNDPNLSPLFVEIKGRQNYRCHHNPRRRVNVGLCITEKRECGERYRVCPYWVQKMKALRAQSVLLSFSYLIAEGQTEGMSDTYLGKRSLLVLDESHNIEEQCLNAVSVRVDPFSIPKEVYDKHLPELRKLKTDTQLDRFLTDLEDDLKKMSRQAEKVTKTTGLSVDQAYEIEKIDRYLDNYHLYKASQKGDQTSQWVWQLLDSQLIIQPVFARDFMEQLVWKRADYYIISSATILDPYEFVELTGLSTFLTKDEISFLQVPSTFPVQNRPIIDSTVGRLSKQEWEENKNKALQAIGKILKKEKGNVAIHCHSYQHQQWLTQNISKDLQSRLIVHSNKDRSQKLQEWMHSRGKVFVSVAFSEGQDWKYDLCDAQILLKVPYPYLGDKRVQKRLELGYRQWYENHAMSEVIQAYGRAIRAEDDKARFYIIDGSFKWLVRQCWRSIPEWFKEALPLSIYDLKSGESINMNTISRTQPTFYK